MPFLRFPEHPPQAVSASLTGPAAVRVMFDQPLAAGPLDHRNWTDDAVFFPQQARTAAASKSQVDVTFEWTPQMGVRYNPPPFDLLGENGLAVQAFEIPFS